MRKVKSLMLVPAVLAAMVSTTGTSYAGMGAGMAKPAPSAPAGKEAAPPSNCPSGSVCLYAHTDYRGFLAGWRAGTYTASFTTIPCTSAQGCYTNNDFNDEASSWYNNTNMNYCVSADINGGNPDNTMPAHTYGNFTSDWQDRASSIGYINCP
ncbi:peptidase inhibitor family I36 protein [Spirillospora sp. NPDC050679]